RRQEPLVWYRVQPCERGRHPEECQEGAVRSEERGPLLLLEEKAATGDQEQQERCRQRSTHRDEQVPGLAQQVLAVVLTGESGREHEQQANPKTAAIRGEVENRLPVTDQVESEGSDAHGSSLGLSRQTRLRIA